MSMDESYHDDIPKVSNREKEMLVAPFIRTSNERQNFPDNHNTTRSRWSPTVLSSFLNLMKDDLMAMVVELHKGKSCCLRRAWHGSDMAALR